MDAMTLRQSSIGTALGGDHILPALPSVPETIVHCSLAGLLAPGSSQGWGILAHDGVDS